MYIHIQQEPIRMCALDTTTILCAMKLQSHSQPHLGKSLGMRQQNQGTIKTTHAADYTHTNLWNVLYSIHTCTTTYIHTYIHTHIHTYIHTYTHTYIHTYIRVRTYRHGMRSTR